ncbi:putative type IV pilin accessory protein [Acinetobacter baumannii 1437282]|nr:putative type IV pilin accessory protein [Acinetobacter baumannii 1437282]
MLLGIDLILGPALTWLVYKEGKKSLKFDLTVIILIQISALCYGVYHIAQGRPAWMVYSVDRFDLIKNNEIYTKNTQEAAKEFQQPSWLEPQYAAIQFALDSKQKNQDMFDEILGGVEISQRPERYVALVKVKQQIQKRAQNLDVLNQFNDKVLVEKILSNYPQATAFVPLKANAVDMTVLINKEKGEVVKIVDLRPWK